MSVALPTPDQLRAVADQCGLALTDEDVTSFRGLMQGSIDAYNTVAAMPTSTAVPVPPQSQSFKNEGLRNESRHSALSAIR